MPQDSPNQYRALGLSALEAERLREELKLELGDAKATKKSIGSYNGVDLPWVAEGPFSRDRNIKNVSPSLAPAVSSISKYFPELSDRASGIISGPTRGSMDLMTFGSKGRFTPDAFAGTNLLGVTDTKTNEIGLNPSLEDRPELYSTLMHELMHTQGYGEGTSYLIGSKAANVLQNIFARRKQ